MLLFKNVLKIKLYSTGENVTILQKKLCSIVVKDGVMVTIGLELHSVAEMTEFCLEPGSGAARGRDTEGWAWLLEVDLHSHSLRFPLYLAEPSAIPRNHLRLIAWRAFLVRRSKATQLTCSITKPKRRYM